MEMERLTRKLCTDSSTGTVYFVPPCVLATFLLADWLKGLFIEGVQDQQVRFQGWNWRNQLFSCQQNSVCAWQSFSYPSVWYSQPHITLQPLSVDGLLEFWNTNNHEYIYKDVSRLVGKIGRSSDWLDWKHRNTRSAWLVRTYERVRVSLCFAEMLEKNDVCLWFNFW